MEGLIEITFASLKLDLNAWSNNLSVYLRLKIISRFFLQGFKRFYFRTFTMVSKIVCFFTVIIAIICVTATAKPSGHVENGE